VVGWYVDSNSCTSKDLWCQVMLRDVIMVRGLIVAYYMVYGLNLFLITIIILQVDFVELS
jgi:hypothetical protein